MDKATNQIKQLSETPGKPRDEDKFQNLAAKP